MSRPGPAALVGLLAEPDRLRAFAAVVLGATTAADVAVVAGLEARAAVVALERLAAGGLVVAGSAGFSAVGADVFKQAARSEAARQRAAASPESLGAVLRSFVVGGRLERIPAQHSKRLVVLDWLSGRFEPGVVYAERDVNLLLGMAHADVASLRRYLVDEGFLERRDGFYWRAGGTFDV